MSSGSAGRGPRAGQKQSKAAKDIRVVSDATGGLARHMLGAVLTQFDGLERSLRCHAFCDSEEKLRASLKELKPDRSLVFSALASQSLKTTIRKVCGEAGVPHFDLTGGCVSFLEQHTGLQASNDIGAVHKHDTAYFERIDALEFSLQHDDSRRLESIQEADIVLVGLSRVSKTPTTAYLGWLGHRVANVSLVPGHKVPKQLTTCRAKSVGLTMRPKSLAEIRTRRFTTNGFLERLSTHPYIDMRTIIREVMDVESEFRRLNIPVIDISHLTIEEIAARVLEARSPSRP